MTSLRIFNSFGNTQQNAPPYAPPEYFALCFADALVTKSETVRDRRQTQTGCRSPSFRLLHQRCSQNFFACDLSRYHVDLIANC